MKMTKVGSKQTLNISRDEWLNVGEQHGWVKTASYSPLQSKNGLTLSKTLGTIMKTAAAGDIHDVTDLGHVILVNAGQDTGIEGFAGALQDALKENANIETPRIVNLDVGRVVASGGINESLKKSAGQILTSSNTIWNIKGQCVTTDVLRLFQDNGNLGRTNTWVVVETED